MSTWPIRWWLIRKLAGRKSVILNVAFDHGVCVNPEVHTTLRNFAARTGAGGTF